MYQFRVVCLMCCLALLGLTAGCSREVGVVGDQDELNQYLKEHPELVVEEEEVPVQRDELNEDGSV